MIFSSLSPLYGTIREYYHDVLSLFWQMGNDMRLDGIAWIPKLAFSSFWAFSFIPSS